MIRYLLVTICLVVLPCFAWSMDDVALIDQLVNEWVDEGKGDRLANAMLTEGDIAQNIEDLSGESWLSLADAVKAEGTLRLKCEYLRVEYLSELLMATFDLEDAKTAAEKKAVKERMALYLDKLNTVTRVMQRALPAGE